MSEIVTKIKTEEKILQNSKKIVQQKLDEIKRLTNIVNKEQNRIIKTNTNLINFQTDLNKLNKQVEKEILKKSNKKIDFEAFFN